eukprot:6689098-Pyramimonas_sp.AAC.1
MFDARPPYERDRKPSQGGRHRARQREGEATRRHPRVRKPTGPRWWRLHNFPARVKAETSSGQDETERDRELTRERERENNTHTHKKNKERGIGRKRVG